MSKKRLSGVVVSNKMNKTVVVAVDSFRRHPLYEKIIKATRKHKAESAEVLPVGTQVEIEQTRPLSRDKCWRVVSVGKNDKPEVKKQ